MQNSFTACISPKKLSLLQNRSPGIIPRKAHTDYAIVFPVVMCSGEPHFLFEKRSEALKRQPGEICFPGGRVEPGEEIRRAALRECCEELCIGEDKIEIICPLDVLTTYSGLRISPFLAELKDYRFTFSKDEVEEVFILPISYFLNTKPDIYIGKIVLEQPKDFPFSFIPGGKDYPWAVGKQETHFYHVDGRVIWGLTARLIYYHLELLKEIFV